MDKYTFNGLLYVPKSNPLKIAGEFKLDNPSSLEGIMTIEGDKSRDKIQGILIDTETFCIPGDPKAFLLFAYFSDDNPNHHFSMLKQGLDLEGEYRGVRDKNGGEVKGIDPRRYIENVRYIDMILNESNHNRIELTLRK